MRPLLLAAAVLAGALPARAQPPASPLMRGDASGTIGWLSGRKADVPGQVSGDWYSHGVFVSAAAGWYWTEHHKTDIEAGATSRIGYRVYAAPLVDGFPAVTSSAFTFTLRRLAVGHEYQFRHNAVFHPYIGAGVDITWERALEHDEAVSVFDQNAREARELRPAVTIGPTTTLRVRPYAETGFKAYLSPRAFFRAGARVLVHGGVNEVLLRCGFGFDF